MALLGRNARALVRIAKIPITRLREAYSALRPQGPLLPQRLRKAVVLTQGLRRRNPRRGCKRYGLRCWGFSASSRHDLWHCRSLVAIRLLGLRAIARAQAIVAVPAGAVGVAADHTTLRLREVLAVKVAAVVVSGLKGAVVRDAMGGDVVPVLQVRDAMAIGEPSGPRSALNLFRNL